MILLFVACFGLDPLQNEPPRLLSVNGIRAHLPLGETTGSVELPAYTPGQDYRFEVEVDDPEGDGVLVYFPAWNGVVDFDPAARSGVWHVPREFPPPELSTAEFTIYLRDDVESDPAGVDYSVQFERGAIHTGRPDPWHNENDCIADIYWGNNTFEQAVPIPIGEDIIGDGREARYWSVEVAPHEEVALGLQGYSAWAIVYNQSGEWLDEFMWFDEQAPVSFANSTDQPKVYGISLQMSRCQDYRISEQRLPNPCGLDPYEPNDTLGAALPVPSGEALTVHAQEPDRFSVPLSPGAWARISATGDVILEAGSTGGGGDLILENAEITPNERSFVVRADQCMSYELQVERHTPDCTADRFEPNNTDAEASALVDHIEANVDASDVDVYEVQVPADARFTLQYGSMVWMTLTSPSVEPPANLIVSSRGLELYDGSGPHTVRFEVRSLYCLEYTLQTEVLGCEQDDTNEPNDDLLHATESRAEVDQIVRVGHPDYFHVADLESGSTVQVELNGLRLPTAQLVTAAGSPLGSLNYVNTSGVVEPIYLQVSALPSSSGCDVFQYAFTSTTEE